MQDEKYNKQYERWGAARPSHAEHGFPEDIRERLEKAVVEKWWLQGNQLFAETQHGTVSQTIPTNYICVGMDDKGLPMLQKIGMN
jgi:hypothetical protein